MRKRHRPVMLWCYGLFRLREVVSTGHGTYFYSGSDGYIFDTSFGARVITYMICMGCLYGRYEEDNLVLAVLHLATAFWAVLRDTMFGSTVPIFTHYRNTIVCMVSGKFSFPFRHHSWHHPTGAYNTGVFIEAALEDPL